MAAFVGLVLGSRPFRSVAARNPRCARRPPTARDALKEPEPSTGPDLSVTLGALRAAGLFKDGRYGLCPSCQDAILVPGLSMVYCDTCGGWVPRDSRDPELQEKKLALKPNADTAPDSFSH